MHSNSTRIVLQITHFDREALMIRGLIIQDANVGHRAGTKTVRVGQVPPGL